MNGEEALAEMLGGLAAGPRHSLESPMRRRILRALNQAGELRTSTDLSTILGGTSVSEVNYQLSVLVGDGCVTPSGGDRRSNRGKATQSRTTYASCLVDDAAARAILSCMRESDEPEWSDF